MKLRPRASLVAAVALVGALAGCSVFTVGMTQHPYDASDGVSVTVGDVRLLNIIVFTEDGEDGNLAAAVVNSGDEDVDLVLQYESDGDKVDVEVEVPARSTLRLGAGEDGQLLLPGIDTPAGALLKVYVQYGSTPGKQVEVPVLDTRLAEYDGLLPTPTPTPTESATPESDETPEPTETPAP